MNLDGFIGIIIGIIDNPEEITIVRCQYFINLLPDIILTLLYLCVMHAGYASIITRSSITMYRFELDASTIRIEECRINVMSQLEFMLL